MVVSGHTKGKWGGDGWIYSCAGRWVCLYVDPCLVGRIVADPVRRVSLGWKGEHTASGRELRNETCRKCPCTSPFYVGIAGEGSRNSMLIRWMVSAGETMMDSTGSNVGG